jgi:hypothetical protein
MVVKFYGGMKVHEPPFTKAEEDEFYRRIGGGPVTVARPAGDKTTNKKSAKKRRDKTRP